MIVNVDQPNSFGVFCKNCGSYYVDVYVNLDEEIVFWCKNKECDTKETF
jgi:hypothetical protein